MQYFKFKNNEEPKKGSLLLSEPFLPDPNFERTVVLMCEHNEEGSFGFVLNKPSAVALNDILDDVGVFDAPVYVGGPVQQDTLHFIHKNADLEGGKEISPGLFWGGNFEQLTLLLKAKAISKTSIRFFVGYSGWEDGQLVRELESESWIVTPPASVDLVLDPGVDSLWKNVLKQLGGRFNIYSNYPIDPRLN